MRKAICIAAAVLSLSAGMGGAFGFGGNYDASNGYGAHLGEHCAYVDDNGDGVCDVCAYVDQNGDGICDHRAYVDENGDGVCDACPNGGIPARDGEGRQWGAGHHSHSR